MCHWKQSRNYLSIKTFGIPAGSNGKKTKCMKNSSKLWNQSIVSIFNAITFIFKEHKSIWVVFEIELKELCAS